VQRHPIPESRKARDLDPCPPDNPDRVLGHTRVLDVGVRDILEPARQRVEAGPPRGRAVAEAGARLLGVQAAAAWRLDEVVVVDPPEGTVLR
jgi:hypothetical protein